MYLCICSLFKEAVINSDFAEIQYGRIQLIHIHHSHFIASMIKEFQRTPQFIGSVHHELTSYTRQTQNEEAFILRVTFESRDLTVQPA
jgi:hypothetical protein